MKKWLWFTLSIALLSLLGFGVVQFVTTGNLTPPISGDQAVAAEKSSVPAEISKEEQRGKPLPTVTVETVTTQLLSRTVALTGTVIPTRMARLASPGEGPVEACVVTNCMAREGDQVKKGQVLLQISRNKAAQAQLVAAAQGMKEQEAELQRVTQLVEGGAIPGDQLDTARSKYENARAQFAKAVESSEDYMIAAPWAGVVSRVYVTEGDYVAPRTPLVEIFDPASLVVQFAIPESQSMEVHIGMPVEVQLDAYPKKIIQGTINRVYPQLDDHTRTRTVEAVLTDPVDLIPGMFCRIQVTLTRIPDAVTVPVHILVPDPDGGYAAFVLEEEKAVLKKLETGLEIDGRVYILSGLKAGDRIIVAGHEKLENGSVVKVLERAAVQTNDVVKGGTRP